MYLNPKEHEIHKGYYYCWFANETIVDKYGNAISLKTNKKLPIWLDKTTEMMRGIIHHNGGVIYSFISVLIAKTFIMIPEYLNNQRVYVDYLDKNKLNTNLENLKWVSSKEIQINVFQKRRSEIRQKFNLPNYVDNIDFYDLVPIECPFKKGYFYIPFSKAAIVINKEGHLFNLETNQDHPIVIDKKGYYNTHLGADNFQLGWKVHRIVALIFNKKKEHHNNVPFSELEVNHKDGNKSNNNWQNLEWVTTEENMRHAWDNDFIKVNMQVLARNVITNEIVEYFSISECSKHFEIDITTLSIHLRTSSAGRIIKNNHVFKLKENKDDWPKEIAVFTKRYPFRSQCNFVFINRLTTECLIFCSIPEACEYLHLPINSIKCNKTRNIWGNKPTKGWFYISLEDYINNGKEMYCDLI